MPDHLLGFRILYPSPRSASDTMEQILPTAHGHVDVSE